MKALVRTELQGLYKMEKNIKPNTILDTDRVDEFTYQLALDQTNVPTLLFTVPLKKTLVDITLYPYIVSAKVGPSIVTLSDLNWTIKFSNRDLEWIKVTPLLEEDQTVPVLGILKEQQDVWSVPDLTAVGFDIPLFLFLRITGTLVDNNSARLYQYEGVKPYGATRNVG